MPKVSVIIPVYNTEKNLRECLDSVVNQTLKDIEIICINDGSTDGSLEILKEYAQKDTRIKIIDKTNEGVSLARNNGLKEATGEYIGFVDSDDYIKNNALEILYNKAINFDLDMLSFGGTNFDNATGKILGNSYYEFKYLPDDFNIDCFSYKDCTNFITEMAVSSCLTIYKFSFIKNNKISFPPYLFFEDNVFWVKALFNAKKIGILKEILYFRRLHDKSTTQNWCKLHLDFVKVVELVLDYLKSNNIDEDIYEKYLESYSYIILNKYNKFDNAYKRKYYTYIKEFYRKYNPSYVRKVRHAKNIFTKIFAINNEGIRKVITLLGFKIKIKSKRLIEQEQKRLQENNINKIANKNKSIKESYDAKN